MFLACALARHCPGGGKEGGGLAVVNRRLTGVRRDHVSARRERPTAAAAAAATTTTVHLHSWQWLFWVNTAIPVAFTDMRAPSERS